MSTTTLYTSPPPPLTTVTTSSPNSPISQNLNSIGLGYAIAIALGFLVLLSTILLSSYICCRSASTRRRNRHHHHQNQPHPNNSSNDNAVYLPRIIFVAEDEEESENTTQNVVVGLDQAVINSYPKFIYSKKFGNNNNNDTMCPICLCEYKDAEMLRMLPDCKHYFHVTCVDAWLKLSASCPVCRNSPLPTPLSEVVPLSQYSDGRRRV